MTYDYARAAATINEARRIPWRGHAEFSLSPAHEAAAHLAYPWWGRASGRGYIHLVDAGVLDAWRHRQRIGLYLACYPNRRVQDGYYEPVLLDEDSRVMCPGCMAAGVDPDEDGWSFPPERVTIALAKAELRRRGKSHDAVRQSRARVRTERPPMSLADRIKHGLQHDPQAWTDLGDGRWRAPKGAIYGERTAVVQAVIRQLRGADR